MYSMAVVQNQDCSDLSQIVDEIVTAGEYRLEVRAILNKVKTIRSGMLTNLIDVK